MLKCHVMFWVFFFWSLGCRFPFQITNDNNKHSSSGWVNLMHINILVKYMTAKCLQNQPDILWYKNGTDKMNVRHQREKKYEYMNWWWNYTSADDVFIFYMNMKCHDWQINPICIKKNVTCRYIVLQKINYHIGKKKKITQQNFRSVNQRHCQHLYILRYFFPSYLTQFSTPNNCSR